MPNWCSNSITIRGSEEDIGDFEQFLEANNGKNWFDYFLPCPPELLEGQGWYEWSVQNWGTKWNCDAQDWKVSEDGTEISFWFDSAWSPPTTLYNFIVNEQGDFDITAQYLEEGMAFVGEYADGMDESYEYSDLESLDDIPEHIVENWNLREMMEDREEFDDEDDENE